MTFFARVKEFRTTKGYTQMEFAKLLGVTKASIARWEAGTSKPSKLAASALEKAGFGPISEEDTNRDSLSRIDHVAPEELLNGVVTEISLGGEKTPILPSPYVINGPENQLAFFDKLIDLQSQTNPECLDNSYLERLSVVREVSGVETSQYRLEQPKPRAKSWSSNYGTHGWHRYIGRFPPHLVRALLNHFRLPKNAVVLDPFVGSGTTLVEARLLGYRGIGADICPLSSLISRAKSMFPQDPSQLEASVHLYDQFYEDRHRAFLAQHADYDIDDVLSWDGNPISRFPNVDKWFSPEALLGTAITVSFIHDLDGYQRDFFSCQLSSLMRSIGNVEVNTVRAEYSKKPRRNVDVRRLMLQRCFKSIRNIKDSVWTHRSSLGVASSISVHEHGIQNLSLEANSVDAIITSPPYGVEAISYLRTHLLSYRSLQSILGHDPYSNSEEIIGSEYLFKNTTVRHNAAQLSESYYRFFSLFDNQDTPKKLQPRIEMMMKFFDEMADCAASMALWLRRGGKLGFVIGNKRLGDHVIPTHDIIAEIFSSVGLKKKDVIKHKLKTNNSNSQVPWQSRIIQDEYVMIFERA